MLWYTYSGLGAQQGGKMQLSLTHELMHAETVSMQLLLLATMMNLDLDAG